MRMGAMAKCSRAALALQCVVMFMSCVGAALQRHDPHSIRQSRSLIDSQDYFAGLVVFGDSTVDVGVNNYLLLTDAKCNFVPYGRIFPGGKPTGRFCDGKIFVDFIAEKIGYPYPLPYLAPNAHGQAILTGISFASASSGWLDSTVSGDAKTFSQQLVGYKNWKTEVVSLVGQERGDFIFKNTLYIISTGTNDWMSTYYLKIIMMSQYTPDAFSKFLTDAIRSSIQELIDMSGGGTIAVLGLLPFGCIPSQITLHGLGKSRACIEDFNAVAMKFNAQLSDMINNELKPNFQGGRLVYVDWYTLLDKMIRNPSAYGISETNIGCCGTGLIEAGPLCNFLSIPTTCQDGNKFLWWDSFHPSEHTSAFLADDIFNQILQP